MKTALIFTISLASATFAVPAFSQDYEPNSYIHTALVQVCSEAAQDDRVGLHKTLRSHRISKQNAVEKVMCNGKRLMAFAEFNQAYRVSSMLKPYADRIKGRVIIQDVTAPPAN
ncbi:DUF3718 domain-containing protein [Rheinheimera salexigens]|uniref:DUF3718 domain-containing protein n=1 Tax=Rheinheimera salexigens TaxID=1628148 RepID=A0A1E7Q4S5_9GAMM|nr:DUF3718 domain-containing protein [Rheinheimera salexigens]OEY69149.1 hypothetical protein BI198_05855 [Rheinheimera salexigens]